MGAPRHREAGLGRNINLREERRKLVSGERRPKVKNKGTGLDWADLEIGREQGRGGRWEQRCMALVGENFAV